MASSRSLSLLGAVLVFAFLAQSALGNNEGNDDRPAVENETIPEHPVNEIIPEPITIKPPGSVEELRPNLVGLANMAIVHLPQSLTFQYVIRATREIVDGVLYELLVNAKDINKNEVICWFVIIEKPWITTEYGDKYRRLRTTNCTADENDKFDPSKYEGNTVFNSSNTEVTQGDLSDLEKQIMAKKKQKPITETEESTNAAADKETSDVATGVILGIESQIVPEKTTTVAPSLSGDSLALLGSLFGMDSTVPEKSSNVGGDNAQNEGSLPCSSAQTPPPGTINADNAPGENMRPENPQPNPVESNLPQAESDGGQMSEDSKAILDSIFRQPVVEPEHIVVRVTPATDTVAADSDIRKPINGGSDDAVVSMTPATDAVPVDSDRQKPVNEGFDVNAASSPPIDRNVQKQVELNQGNSRTGADESVSTISNNAEGQVQTENVENTNLKESLPQTNEGQSLTPNDSNNQEQSKDAGNPMPSQDALLQKPLPTDGQNIPV